MTYYGIKYIQQCRSDEEKGFSHLKIIESILRKNIFLLFINYYVYNIMKNYIPQILDNCIIFWNVHLNN